MNYKFNGYKILAESKFKKIIQKNLPMEYREVFDKKIKYLSNNPEHPSLNTKQFHVSKKRLTILELTKCGNFI